MTKDTPSGDRPPTIRGKTAGHGDAATVLSWLSTALYLTSVPGLLVLAYAGHRAGLYSYPRVIPVYAGLFVAFLSVMYLVMRARTTVR